jgi:sec-independent protein translocase protein TatA
VGPGIVSPWHIAILVLVVVLVFGPKKLPEIGHSLGRGIREFKDSLSHDHDPVDASAQPAALPADDASLHDRDTI